jgi:hypothetical protein
MTRKEIKILKDFVHKHIGPNQTEVVRYLIDEDCTSLIRDEVTLFNYGKYKAHLKEGLFLGKESELYRKMAQVEDKIDYLQSQANKLGEGNFIDKQEALAIVEEIQEWKDQLKLLERAEYVSRPIEAWLVVPYWMGGFLAMKGEVVLQTLGVCWWGKTFKGPTWMDLAMWETYNHFKS